MKRKHFTESQIVSALKHQEGGIVVKEIARDLGISEATFYNWKSKYGGMEASDVKRLKDLEVEHAEFEEDVCRAEHREPGNEKPDRKKAITPARNGKQLVTWLTSSN